jgi:hypothetical protein
MQSSEAETLEWYLSSPLSNSHKHNLTILITRQIAVLSTYYCFDIFYTKSLIFALNENSFKAYSCK